MAKDDAFTRFGMKILIKDVIVGKNLNVNVIRGFARLDQLAYISAPDVYNQVTNPLGTQRDPDKAHAKAVLDYAINSLNEEPDSSPRAFPEIILNARDIRVVELLRNNSEESVDFSSSASESELFFSGSLLVHTQLIDSDREKDPQISRVDGNHRLLMVKKRIEDEPDEEFPLVPFSLFVGLTADQERAIFRDINGEQKPMETAHLDTIRLKLQGASQLLQSESGLALWVAERLSKEDNPFENLIFFGGDKKVFKQAGMQVPPVKINSLKSAVLTTLKDSKQLSAGFQEDSAKLSDETRMQDAQAKLELLKRYWFAVRNNFPDAWQDRTNYILLQAIGLNAFSRLAASVIDDLCDSKTIEQKDFDQVLKHVASKSDLSRGAWAGYAGLAGAKQVFKAIYEARLDGFDRTVILDQLLAPEISPLDK